MKNKPYPIDSIIRQHEAYGFVNFVEAAKTYLKTLVPGEVEHAILSYLLQSAVGMENAKNWKQISQHLKKHGHKLTKNKFQNNLLQSSRKSLFFIGSGCKGFFLFSSKHDVHSTLQFYDTRIATESSHRLALHYLSCHASFDGPADGNDDQSKAAVEAA